MAAWNDHDAGAMADLLTEDIVWEDPALPGRRAGSPRSRSSCAASWVGFPDLRFDETDTPHLTARAIRSRGAGGCAAR